MGRAKEVRKLKTILEENRDQVYDVLVIRHLNTQLLEARDESAKSKSQLDVAKDALQTMVEREKALKEEVVTLRRIVSNRSSRGPYKKGEK